MVLNANREVPVLSPLAALVRNDSTRFLLNSPGTTRSLGGVDDDLVRYDSFQPLFSQPTLSRYTESTSHNDLAEWSTLSANCRSVLSRICQNAKGLQR